MEGGKDLRCDRLDVQDGYSEEDNTAVTGEAREERPLELPLLAEAGARLGLTAGRKSSQGWGK